MDPEKRKKLEAAGWKVGTVQDFLGLTSEEAAFVEVKLALSQELRRRRTEQGLSQSRLARRIGSSQSRIAKAEASDPGVSMDLLVRALLAAGAAPEDIAPPLRPPQHRERLSRARPRLTDDGHTVTLDLGAAPVDEALRLVMRAATLAAHRGRSTLRVRYSPSTADAQSRGRLVGKALQDWAGATSARSHVVSSSHSEGVVVLKLAAAPQQNTTRLRLAELSESS